MIHLYYIDKVSSIYEQQNMRESNIGPTTPCPGTTG